MITVRKSVDRGKADRGWLNSHFTFSFADYHDPEFTGFRALKVMNEDRIAPGKGFGPHAHRDMEIITFVLEGRLAHRDSMSGPHTVGPDEIQTMSAGTGVVHSEFNASETEPVHLMQIWIEPAAEDFPPAYQQLAIPTDRKRGRLYLLAGPATGSEQPLTTINQDACLYVAALEAEERVVHALAPVRYGWVQVIRGSASLNGQALEEGDGAAISGEREVTLAGVGSGGEVLLFDLP